MRRAGRILYTASVRSRAAEQSLSGWRQASSTSQGTTALLRSFGSREDSQTYSKATLLPFHTSSHRLASGSAAHESLGKESTTANQFDNVRSDAEAQGKTINSKGGSPTYEDEKSLIQPQGGSSAAKESTRSYEEDTGGRHTAEDPRVEHAAPPGAIGSNDASAAGIPAPGSAPSVGPAPAEGEEPKSAQERADQAPAPGGYGGGGSASGGVGADDDGSMPDVAKETAKDTDTGGTGQGAGAAPGMGAEGQTS